MIKTSTIENSKLLLALYNYSYRFVENKQRLEAIWNTYIDGITPPIRFIDIAANIDILKQEYFDGPSGKYNFANSVINFAHAMLSLPLKKEYSSSASEFNDLVNGVKNYLLNLVGDIDATPVTPTGRYQDIKTQRMTPEAISEEKYNASGEINTVPSAITAEEAQRLLESQMPQTPFGKIYPSFKMEYNPGKFKMGKRYRKIFRYARDNNSKYGENTNIADTRNMLQQKILNLKEKIDNLQLPSPEQFVNTIGNPRLSREQTQKYIQNVMEKTNAAKQIMYQEFNNMLRMNDNLQQQQNNQNINTNTTTNQIGNNTQND